VLFKVCLIIFLLIRKGQMR
jgi:hypothetical protein